MPKLRLRLRLEIMKFMTCTSSSLPLLCQSRVRDMFLLRRPALQNRPPIADEHTALVA